MLLWKKHGKIHAFVGKPWKKAMLFVKLSATILWKKHGKNPFFCGKSTEKIHASFKIISYCTILWKKHGKHPCFFHAFCIKLSTITFDAFVEKAFRCFCGKSMEYSVKTMDFGSCGKTMVFVEIHGFFSTNNFPWILHALNTREVAAKLPIHYVKYIP